ncbi:MAG: hypothetical protein EBW21_05840 [Actinobacteria bacterium]|jgi:hypothetical protein|nr:hypothetical protein [Actinomycetota bacterium]
MKKLIFVCVTWTVLASVLPASAGVTGRSVRTQTTSTASWGVSVVNQNNVITNQDYPLTLTASGNTSYNYFSLRNTGSLTTNNFTVSLLQDVIKNKNLKPGDVIFERCDGLWNTTTNTCSVTPVQVATGVSSSFQITIPLNVGAEIKMRARTPNNNQSIGFSLRVQVPRSSIRGGQVTHS